jgi:drug/metabolite transporter (DMT)-like permease
LALIGATCCWGITPVLLKWLTFYVDDGFTCNLVRYPTAALVYVPWMIWALRRNTIRRFWLYALVPGGVNVVLQTLWAWSPYYLDAGLLSFLFRLYVVWAILGAFIVFPDERRLSRSLQFWIGCILAGTGFIIMSVLGLEERASVSMIGLILIFLCSIAFGMYGVSVRWSMGGQQHPMVAFSVIAAYTSLGVIVMSPFGEPSQLMDLNTKPAIILVVSALIGIAMAHGLFYIAVQRIGVAICTLTLMAAPFVSLLGSYVMFEERFTFGQWMGGILLIGGSAVAVWTQQHLKEEKPAAPPTEAEDWQA